ncbi:MAG TPA: cytochrome c [Arenimonas sp.]|uniref:c-type cytochrome n=1 Tax=Arenimonas sp. TaxID=1872635 RepID=UPI002D7E6489|nr:cytochrome c [Arenimonas sp.]HEU0152903.1 cytochrome c [Arenimonas sp.]
MSPRPGTRRFAGWRLLALAAGLAAPALAVEPAAPDPAGMLGVTGGAEIYAQVCQGCHMPGGRGAQGAGQYPALAGNPRLASAPFVITTVLGGRRNMPAFDADRAPAGFFPPTWLTDEQVANVVNYLRTQWGNDYPDPVTAADVRAVRPEKGN